MNFDEALPYLADGDRITRASWAPGTYLVLIPGSTFTVDAARPFGQAAPELVGKSVGYQPHIDMVTSDRHAFPWVATTPALLANDWELVHARGEHHTDDAVPEITVQIENADLTCPDTTVTGRVDGRVALTVTAHDTPATHLRHNVAATLARRVAHQLLTARSSDTADTPTPQDDE